MDKEKTNQTDKESSVKTVSTATKGGDVSSRAKSEDQELEKKEETNKKSDQTETVSSTVEANKPAEKDEINKEQSEVQVNSTFRKKKRNRRRQVRRGRVYIKSSYNNTIVLFSDMHGNALAWSSAGSLGFKGAKKATTYAANQVALDADEKVRKYGLKDVEVFVKGVGSGRDAALRALAQKGYNIISIKDTTPVPHNGCRPRKPRRV